MSVNRHPNTQGVTIKQWRYTATGGETTLSGTDGFSQSLTYTPGAEEVFVNGVLLVRGTDYTASTGTTVVLNNALVAGDIATVSAPSVFNVANSIPSSTVTAKGDLLVANGSASLTNLAVGADGSTLVANSSAGGGVSWAGPQFVAGRNKIINGDFGIWQRGTSFSNPATGTYTADRFAVNFDGSGAARTISQQAFTPGSAPVAGYEGTYFARFNQGTAGSGATYNNFQQKIEDVRILAGQTATVSFWAKADSTRTVGVAYYQYFGSGGSSDVIGSTNNVSVTTSWARYSVTLSIPSVSGKTIGSGSFLIIELQQPLNTTFTIDYWGVQVEAGSVATPFTTATGTVQGELNACERYYERSTPGVAYGKYGQAYYNNSSSQVVCNVEFKTTKRVIPTSIDYANLRIQQNGIGALGTISAVSINIESTTKLADLTVTIGSGATNTLNPIELMNDNNTAGYLGFSAEL